MRQLNKTARVALEQAGNEEARAVLEQLKRIEDAKLKPDEAKRALAAVQAGLATWRAAQREYHEAELAKLRAKYERDAERRAPAESVRLSRLQAKLSGMTDDEVDARARALLDTERMDADEIELLSGRLREAGNLSLRDELRTAATERRAWQPWTWDGSGAEHADAVEDLAGRDMRQVAIDFDGTRISAPIDELLDINGELEQQAPA